jgi:signal transduction histidine kinase
MNRKKNKASLLVNNKYLDFLADQALERKLISSPQNSVLCDIATEFNDQFHYLIKIKKNKIEVFFSPSVEMVTGYKPEELVKFNLLGRELIVDEDLPEIKKQISLLEVDAPHNIEKDATKTILGLVVDVTKFRQEEESLKKNISELQNKVKSRDNFLSILSHDLRAPFSSILGFTEILLSDAVLSDSEKTEYLNYINDSSSNQLKLVNYLLDWSNLQTGRLHIDQHRVQAQNLVFNCISALTGNAMRKNIDIKVNVPESIFIEVDERLMVQVITNLVSNAIKFSESGKTININADRFNNSLVEFVISDEGIVSP